MRPRRPPQPSWRSSRSALPAAQQGMQWCLQCNKCAARKSAAIVQRSSRGHASSCGEAEARPQRRAGRAGRGGGRARARTLGLLAQHLHLCLLLRLERLGGGLEPRPLLSLLNLRDGRAQATGAGQWGRRPQSCVSRVGAALHGLSRPHSTEGRQTASRKASKSKGGQPTLRSISPTSRLSRRSRPRS